MKILTLIKQSMEKWGSNFKITKKALTIYFGYVIISPVIIAEVPKWL